MTEALGPVRYAQNAGFGFLNTQTRLRQELGPETAALIDREIRRLVDQAQDQALELLSTHKAELDEIARVLQEKEVIDGDEIARIAGNRTPNEKE
jgi:cell division protease FtsH